jgi:hypothetical protein
MKILAKPLMLAAALSVAATPAFAQSAAQTPRAAATLQDESNLAGAGENDTFVYGVIIAIVIAAAVLIATNDTPDEPLSP